MFFIISLSVLSNYFISNVLPDENNQGYKFWLGMDEKRKFFLVAKGILSSYYLCQNVSVVNANGL